MFARYNLWGWGNHQGLKQHVINRISLFKPRHNNRVVSLLVLPPSCRGRAGAARRERPGPAALITRLINNSPTLITRSEALSGERDVQGTGHAVTPRVKADGGERTNAALMFFTCRYTASNDVDAAGIPMPAVGCTSCQKLPPALLCRLSSAQGARRGEEKVGASMDWVLLGSFPPLALGQTVFTQARDTCPLTSSTSAKRMGSRAGDARHTPRGPEGPGSSGTQHPVGGDGKVPTRTGSSAPQHPRERASPSAGSPGGCPSQENLQPKFCVHSICRERQIILAPKKQSLAAQMLLGKSGPTYAGN